MMFKDEILVNERRGKIYACIKRNPGLHLRQIQRILNIPLASLQYHLNYMSRRKIIFEEKSESYTRYYCEVLEPKDNKILSVLRQKRLREILLLVLINKKVKSQTIVKTLNLSPSTISFYLNHLVKNNILERTKVGYENIYTLKEEDRIEKILIAYQPSFMDKMVDKWASTWLETSLVKDQTNQENTEPDKR
ncbi:MAG: transcriptional regulator [Candidatus Bathyarchaeota archaeon]|nr:transcriptional regulator [Candidatus Bathyarchaeota archaeon]